MIAPNPQIARFPTSVENRCVMRVFFWIRRRRSSFRRQRHPLNRRRGVEVGTYMLRDLGVGRRGAEGAGRLRVLLGELSSGGC